MLILAKYRVLNSILGINPLYGFFVKTLAMQSSEHYQKFGFNYFNYYEFGTGEGNSLKTFISALKYHCKISRIPLTKYNIFAFDSFEGLPEYRGSKDYNPSWRKGQFYGSEEMIDNIVRKSKFNGQFFKIKGYYQNSLTKKLQKKLKKFPPSIVNIDVGYYTSAKLTLNFLAPILQDGTMFYFDDIYEYLGNQNKGEVKAMKEFEEKYGISMMPYYQHGIPTIFGKTFIFNRNKT